MTKYNINEKELITDYNNGMQTYELAEKFGIPDQTICYRLRKYGIKVRQSKRRRIYTQKDRSGEKIGRLLLLEQVYNERLKRTYYKCKCDCGKIIEVRSDCLLTQRSCKCLRKDTKYPTVGKISGSYYNKIRSSAINHGREWKITIEYLADLFEKQKERCALSGIQLISAPNGDRFGEGTLSLDRINSNIDYIEGNVQWVHKIVNVMKTDLIEKDFIEWCKLISKGPKS